MKWFHCFCWAVWSLLLMAAIGAWVRAHIYSETFEEADDFGEVRGLITSPSGLLLFKNSSQSEDPWTLNLPTGFHYSNAVALPGNPYDLHALSTHRGLNGVIAAGGPFPIPPWAPPVFTSRFTAPGIRVRSRSFNGINCEEVVVAFWLPVFALMLVPVESMLRVVIRVSRARRRRKRGLCLACGYDLRGSEMRCPECGTPMPASLNCRHGA